MPLVTKFHCDENGTYSVRLLITRSTIVPSTTATDDRRMVGGVSVCTTVPAESSADPPKPPRLLHVHSSSTPATSMYTSSSPAGCLHGGALGDAGGTIGGNGGGGEGEGEGGGEGEGEGGGEGEGEGGGGEGAGGEGGGGLGPGGGCGPGGEGGGEGE